MGVAVANTLREPGGLEVGSLLLSFVVYFLVVTPIIAVLFWLWDKTKRK